MVEPKDLINLTTGEKWIPKETYAPNEIVSFKVQFAIYQFEGKKITYLSQEVIKTIVPGEGSDIISVPMVKLRVLEFVRAKQKIVLDGIEYPIVFSVDNQQIEDHLIKTIYIENPENSEHFYNEILTPYDAKVLRMYGGYMYLEDTMEHYQPGMVLSRFDHISVEKLIEHLRLISIEKKNPSLAILDSIEKILKSFLNHKLLKKCPTDKIKQFIIFLETWEEVDAQNYHRWDAVIKKIIHLCFE